MSTTTSVRLDGGSRVVVHTYADQSPILVFTTTGSEVVFSAPFRDPDVALRVADDLADAFARFAAATREHAARQVGSNAEAVAVAQ